MPTLGDRTSAATTAAGLAGAIAIAAHAGVLETFDDEASIGFSALSPPKVLAEGTADFSLLLWLRREGAALDWYRSVLDTGGVLRIGFDDDARVVRFELIGKPAPLVASVPLRDASGTVPHEEWMLLACTWDGAAGRLTAWAQSETLARASASASDPAWTGALPWPPRLGASGGAPSFLGQVGMLVIRDHGIDGDDLDALWRDGAPHYAAPARLETGSMTGFDGVAWMIGHGVVTSPRAFVNPDATGAELGAVVTVNNLLVYNARDSSNYFSCGFLRDVIGTWTMSSPHAPDAAWSGFFVRERPDLGVEGPVFSSLASPRARRVARDEPAGLIRVVASANSRAARTSRSYGVFENWGIGGLFAARRRTVAGVIIPAWTRSTTSWPGFNGTARTTGMVLSSDETPRASVAFGNFGSHGETNPSFLGFGLAGRAVVIEPGGAYVPKARPEPGTRFADKTGPLCVRALLLRFPGAGEVVAQGEKAATQHTTTVTLDGEPTVLALDTTVHTHVMTTRDRLDASARTITLGATVDAIEIGHACFIGGGDGEGGVSVVTDVERRESSTVLTLERWFAVDPDPASSVLRFGPVETVWVGHAWEGLDEGDPEEYRGVRLAAQGGIVVLLFTECFNPAADGFVVGSVGTSGRGYRSQLDLLFDETGVPFVAGLAVDVWLQFFAHEGADETSMGAYAEAIRAASPGTELWWCGDPDQDVTTEDREGTDAWQHYILERAPAFGVGAVVAQMHPTIGTGNERASDGQTANSAHLSGRGCQLYVEAVLDIMGEAALGEPPVCPADLDGDGSVGVPDLLLVVADWGPCAPEGECPADLDGDGVVGVADLVAVLASWGPCPAAPRTGRTDVGGA